MQWLCILFCFYFVKSVIHYFIMFRICLDIFVLDFRNAWLKSVICSESFYFLHFVTTLEITIMVPEKKSLKNKDIQNASLACIIDILIFL